MNKLVITFFVALFAMAVAETYTDRYDNIDVDEILANRTLLVSYIKCILDNGRCTAEGKELKRHIHDAMVTGCQKCTEKQKQMARKIVSHIKEKEAEYWEQMKAKYDPGNQYKETYETFLAAKN